MIPDSFFRTVLIVLAIGMVSACSSTHPYRSSSPENLSIKPDIRAGSAWVNVYEVNKACTTQYLGTVDLESSRVKVAIPVNKLSYLQFNFATSSVFTGSSRNSYGIYLTPQTGYQYDATVSNADDMFSLMVYEQNSRGGSRHEITRVVPKECDTK